MNSISATARSDVSNCVLRHSFQSSIWQYLFLFSTSPERVILKPSWLNLDFFPGVDNRHSRVLKIKRISGDKTIILLKYNRCDQ